MTNNTWHFNTLSDHNYISNGLCLYDSLLEKSSQDFMLHYLCVDRYTYDKLNSLKLSHLKTYTLKDVAADSEFATLKENNACRPIDKHAGVQGSDQSDFHFALASFFSYFLLNQHALPHILYIDSDIVFYHDPKSIFNSVQDKSIGLITHRHMKMDKANRNPGYYNVGIVYFQNNEVGKSCLKFWRDCCIYPNNQYSQIFGACGDQKYLELFEDFFDSDQICIMDFDIGHGAPWNFTMFEFLDSHKIVWHDPEGNVLSRGEKRTQDLVFAHFSHFVPDYSNMKFKFDRAGEWGPDLPSHAGVIDIYIEYFQSLLQTRQKYSLT